jgi:hypothetical protein
VGIGEKIWPVINPMNFLRYYGILKDGKAVMKGMVVYSKGSKYEGEFKNDLPDGQGIRTWPKGRTFKKYRGAFR